jgi:hypothetical protein
VRTEYRIAFPYLYNNMPNFVHLSWWVINFIIDQLCYGWDIRRFLPRIFKFGGWNSRILY